MEPCQEDTGIKPSQPTPFRPARCALTPDGVANPPWHDVQKLQARASNVLQQPRPSNVSLSRGSIFNKSSRISTFKTQCRQSYYNRFASDAKHSKICRRSVIKAQDRSSHRHPSRLYNQHLPASLAGWEKSKQDVTEAFTATLSAGLWEGSFEGPIDLHGSHVAAYRKAKEEESEQVVQKILKERQARKTSIIRRVEAVTVNDSDWRCNLGEDLGPLSHRIRPRQNTPVWERLAQNKPRVKVAKKSVKLSLFRTNLPDLSAEQRARVDTEMQRIMVKFLEVPKADPGVTTAGEVLSGASTEYRAENGWDGGPAADALDASGKDSASKVAAPTQQKQQVTPSRKSRLAAVMSSVMAAQQPLKGPLKGPALKAAKKQRQQGAHRGGTKAKAARRSRAALVLSKEVGSAVNGVPVGNVLKPWQAQLGVGKLSSAGVKRKGGIDECESTTRSSVAFKTPRKSTFAARNAERMGQLLQVGGRLDAMLAALDHRRPQTEGNDGDRMVQGGCDADVGSSGGLGHSDGTSTGDAAMEEEWEECSEGLGHDNAGELGSECGESRGSAEVVDDGGEGEEEEDIFSSLPPSLQPAQNVPDDQGCNKQQQQQQQQQEEQQQQQEQEHQQMQEQQQEQQQRQEEQEKLQQQKQEQEQQIYGGGHNNTQVQLQEQATAQRKKVPCPPSPLQRLDYKTDNMQKLQSPRAAVVQKQKQTKTCPDIKQATSSNAPGAGCFAAYVDSRKKAAEGQSPEAKPVGAVPTASSLECDVRRISTGAKSAALGSAAYKEISVCSGGNSSSGSGRSSRSSTSATTTTTSDYSRKNDGRGSAEGGTVTSLEENGAFQKQHQGNQRGLRRSFTWACSDAHPHLCADQIDGKEDGFDVAASVSLSSLGTVSKTASGAAASLPSPPHSPESTKSGAIFNGPFSPPHSTLPRIPSSPRSAPHFSRMHGMRSSPGTPSKLGSSSSAGTRFFKFEEAASESPSHLDPRLPSNGSSIKARGAPGFGMGDNTAGATPSAARCLSPELPLPSPFRTKSAYPMLAETAHARGASWHTHSAKYPPPLGSSTTATGTGLLPKVHAPSSSQPTRDVCRTPEAQKLRSYLYGSSSSPFLASGMHHNALSTASSSPFLASGMHHNALSTASSSTAKDVNVSRSTTTSSTMKDGHACRSSASKPDVFWGAGGDAPVMRKGATTCDAAAAAAHKGGFEIKSNPDGRRGGADFENGTFVWQGRGAACHAAAVHSGAIHGAAARRHGSSAGPGSCNVLGHVTMRSGVIQGDAASPTKQAIQVVNPRLATPFSQRDHKHLLPQLPSSLPPGPKAQPNSSTPSSASQCPAAAGAVYQGPRRGFQGASMARMTAGFDWNNRRRRRRRKSSGHGKDDSGL